MITIFFLLLYCCFHINSNNWRQSKVNAFEWYEEWRTITAGGDKFYHFITFTSLPFLASYSVLFNFCCTVASLHSLLVKLKTYCIFFLSNQGFFHTEDSSGFHVQWGEFFLVVYPFAINMFEYRKSPIRSCQKCSSNYQHFACKTHFDDNVVLAANCLNRLQMFWVRVSQFCVVDLPWILIMNCSVT